jgi:hypothetical protein
MIRFGKEVSINLDAALGREWLETNGIGGSPLEQLTDATAAGITGSSLPRQSRPSAGLFFFRSWKKH